MKSKIEILAKLLQDKLITTEEFILLQEKEIQYIYQNYPTFVQPYTYPQPTIPYTLPVTWCGVTSGYLQTNLQFDPNAMTYTVN